MAEQIAHDVVKEAQSAGVDSPPDVIATPSNDFPAGNGQAPSPSYIANGDASEDVDGAANGVAGETTDGSELRQTESAKPDGGLSVQDSAFAEASGGSDTDTSRADAADLKDEKGHVRSGSVKKPTMFKPVSVTKSFLAKTVQPVVRPGDKGVPNSPTPANALLSAKPRLVAKSALGGMGVRGLAQPNGASGPDASKVWNKNRPVPPPPPRQFTDEELLTKYGIHMATRLQSDETGKDPKWADIDDDEDDWAPETVEWMDGTKSSVVANEAQPSPPLQVEQQMPVQAVNERPAEAAKPIYAPVQKPAPSQSTKTILKPGAQLSVAQKPPGTILKPGGADKPSLVAKTPTAPVKSPWASLPPVDKASPVVINPPAQQPQRPFQRDPHGFDSLPPATSQTKEIAADDFNRAWRDDRGAKELFNAHSGRYEPASEARRGSRHEHQSRGQQPAVLQRPSHHASQNGPAGPSAAFQTRTNAESTPWSRRRASSNLSSVSGRRPSIIHIQDPSQSTDRVDGMSPISGGAIESPRLPHANVERPAPNQGPWVRGPQATDEPAPSDVMPPPPVPVANAPPPQAPYEDPVAAQNRLMKEKLDRAREQKQREREAEEAEQKARKERLALKMAALAPAPPVKSPSLELTATKSADSAASSVAPQQPKSSAVASPPKPPVPTSEGEVAQYGLMKVHQPHPVKKNYIPDSNVTSRSLHEATGHVQGLGPVSPNKIVARPAPQHSSSALGEKGPTRPEAAIDKVNAHWKQAPPTEVTSTWGAPTHVMNAHSTGSNVWGPPASHEKSLGNGTFESKFIPNFGNRNKFDNRMDNRLGDNSRGALPTVHGPIGAAIKSSTPPRQSHFTNTFLNSEAAPENIDDQAFASTHLDSSLQQSMAHTSSLHPPPTSSSLNTLNNNMNAVDRIPRVTTAGWNSFHAVEVSGRPALYDKYDKVVAQKKASTHERDILNAGVIHHIFRIDAAGLNVEHVEVTVYPGTTKPKNYALLSVGQKSSESLAKVQASALEYPDDQPLYKKPTQKLKGPPGGFGGRAPAVVEVVVPSAASAQLEVVVKFDSPPPPEVSSLSAHVDGSKSVVRLPPSKIVVKMPPNPPQTQNKFTDYRLQEAPQAPSGHRHQDASQMIARISGLFGNNHKERKPSSAISSQTKSSFDVSAEGGPVNAVAVTPFVSDQSQDTTSKDSAEDVLFEPPEHGSLPPVKLPADAHQNHRFGYSHHAPLNTTPRAQSRLSPRIKSQTIHEDVNKKLFVAKDGNGNYVNTVQCSVKIPGKDASKAKSFEMTLERAGYAQESSPKLQQQRNSPPKFGTGFSNSNYKGNRPNNINGAPFAPRNNSKPNDGAPFAPRNNNKGPGPRKSSGPFVPGSKPQRSSWGPRPNVTGDNVGTT